MSDIIRNFLLSADAGCPASWITQIRDELKSIESININDEKVTIIYNDGIGLDYYPEYPAKVAFAFRLAGAKNCTMDPEYENFVDATFGTLNDFRDDRSAILIGCWFRHQLELVLDAMDN